MDGVPIILSFKLKLLIQNCRVLPNDYREEFWFFIVLYTFSKHSFFQLFTQYRFFKHVYNCNTSGSLPKTGIIFFKILYSKSDVYWEVALFQGLFLYFSRSSLVSVVASGAVLFLSTSRQVWMLATKSVRWELSYVLLATIGLFHKFADRFSTLVMILFFLLLFPHYNPSLIKYM